MGYETGGAAVYSMINWKRRIVFTTAVAAVILMIIVDMSIGSSSLTFRECVRILLQGPKTEGTYELIVWRVRLPMTLTCVGVGGCLALSGLQVQTITNNPLASPYTLGISC